MMNGKFDKIFIIGFNKCGTRTLHRFFRRNGMSCIHWGDGKVARRMVRNCLADNKLLEGFDSEYRVFSDLGYTTQRTYFEGNAYFRIMDRDYPGSAFILNTRNVDDWVKSRAKHANGRLLAAYKSILGTEDESVIFALWKRNWQNHEADVRQYFTGRDNLLIFDIVNDGPQQITDFLGVDLDHKEYEWVGKTPERAGTAPARDDPDESLDGF